RDWSSDVCSSDLFNIFNDLFQLCRSPHPMIVGFVLPKRLTGAPGERAEKFLTALVMRDSAASSSKLREQAIIGSSAILPGPYPVFCAYLGPDLRTHLYAAPGGLCSRLA